MEQRVSLITLGVRDVARARRFYEHLGWQGQEVDETVFLQANGLAVVLWDRQRLAEDAGIDGDTGASFSGVAAPFGRGRGKNQWMSGCWRSRASVHDRHVPHGSDSPGASHRRKRASQ